MPFLVSFLIALVVSLPTHAEILKLKKGSVLSYQFSAPQSGQPTFLLMPGVNRGTLLEDPAVAGLVQAGAGVITFNFSVQPLSIAALPAGERADLEDVSIESLAEETVALAREIERLYGIPLKRMVPVSLSYSGAVSTQLQNFPVVIDVVPLTSFTAFSPQLAAYYASLKAAEFFNPLFGPGITRASLDAAYKSQWYPQVDSISRQFGLPSARRAEMVEGYTTLSRAVEGYSWLESLPSKKVKRVLVLAEGEAKPLLRDQIQTLGKLEKKGFAIATIVVQDSGHVIPADQPNAYVATLIAVAAGEVKPGTVTVFEPKLQRGRSLSGDEAVEFLRHMAR